MIFSDVFVASNKNNWSTLDQVTFRAGPWELIVTSRLTNRFFPSLCFVVNTTTATLDASTMIVYFESLSFDKK